MLKTKISAFALVAVLLSAGSYAYAAPPPDPCDPAVMSAMSTSAQNGLNKQDSVIDNLMKPPQPSAADSCMRDTFNVWKPDALLSIVGSFFPAPSLGLVGSGMTLTDSTLATAIISAFSGAFGGNFGHLVCNDSWKTMANAKTPLNISSSGSMGFGTVPTVDYTSSKISFK